MTNWIIPITKNTQATIRLFCFPYAGGSSAVFRTWKQHLPPHIALYSIQLPGRETRISEPPETNIQHIITNIVAELTPYLQTPYALFGHSMGALLAFEVLRNLREQQQPLPQHFFASGRSAPQLPRQQAMLQHLPDQAFIHTLNERYGGIDPTILQHQELLDLLIPTLRADMVVVENYQYRTTEPFACPITAYTGKSDEHISPADLAAWGDHTQQDFYTSTFEGGHFFINETRTALIQAITNQLQ